jgi:hypothetical protein
MCSGTRHRGALWRLGRRRDGRDTAASQQAKKQKSVHKFSCSWGINFLICLPGILPNSRFVSQTLTPTRELGRQIEFPLICEKLYTVNRQKWEYFTRRHGFFVVPTNAES